MVTDQTNAPESRRWRFSLRTLVVMHVVALLVACWVSSVFSRQFPIAGQFFMVLTFGQMCLLGIWGGLGTNSGWCRVVGAFAGIAFLMASGCYNIWPNIGGTVTTFEALKEIVPMMLTMFFLPMLGIAAVLLVVRAWKAHLVAREDELQPKAVEGLQFSIRHLLLVTTAVAVLLVMAQWGGLLLKEMPWLRIAARQGMITLSFIAITVASVWAGLGVGRPAERIVVVALLTLFTCVLFMYVTAEADNMNWQEVWNVSLIMVLTAAVVMASLLVVRSNGYRLVRLPPRDTPNSMIPN